MASLNPSSIQLYCHTLRSQRYQDWWTAWLHVYVEVAQMVVLAPVCTAGGLLLLPEDVKKGLGLDKQDLIEERKTKKSSVD